MKIDVFNRIITPRYREARLKIAPAAMRLQDQERVMPALFDLDARFRAMDVAGDGYVQIINTANPPVELGFCAVQIYTDVGGRPLDDPAFGPFFDHVAALDLPELLHPVRGPGRADYPAEDASRFDTRRIVGWLYAKRADKPALARRSASADRPTQGGRKYVQVAIRAMQEIDIPDGDKAKIFEDTARRVFGLPEG